jgi:hypothetical protein
MPARSLAALAAACAACAACAIGCTKPAPPTPLASTAAVASASASPTPGALDLACSPPACHLYDSARDAMQAILDEARPLIVAVGEAHAQKGMQGVDSSARRFAAEMLPLFKGRASDLVVEILMPPRGCEAKTQEVRKRQEPIVEKQAESNQDEYLAMGNAARGLGIVPDLLRPSCADFEKITKAPREDAPALMLETIKQVTVTQVKGLLGRNGRDPEQMIVVYGGAIHGDPAPSPTRAAWSFAADLAPAVKGRYVSVHAFVPEAITDDPSWRTFAWFEHYDRRAHPDKVTVFHLRPDAYVIIFPETRRAPPG